MKQNLELYLPDVDKSLTVRDFRVEEAINKPFQIFLTVLSGEPIDLAASIGQNARFAAALAPTGALLDDLLANPIVRALLEREEEIEARLAERLANVPGARELIDFAHTALLSELDGIRDSLREVMPGADWSGIVADIEEVGSEVNDSLVYRVHLVHPLWVLGQNKNYRIFQHQSELDVARVVLGEWGIGENVLLDPTQYRKRDFRIQYGESDLDFVHRNLEDLGISYYLEDTDDGEVMTLTANPERNEPRAEALLYCDEAPRSLRRPWASAVRIRRAVRPGKYTLQDVDYRLPPTRQPRLTSECPKPVEGKVTQLVSSLEQSIETYEYNPGAFAVEGQASGESPVGDRKQATRTDARYGRWLTEVRLRSVQASRYRIHFETNAFDLHPGAVTVIEGHSRPELSEPVLILESTFTGSANGEWTMRCVAHPTSVPFSPELTAPRPRASGVESATVVGTPGKQIDAQEVGSVLVQFHWDREGDRDDNSSCWVPVSYGLAGPGRGMFSLPRIGEEVLVDFLAGDLDKPMVTGRVYTGLNKPWTQDVSKMGDLSLKNDSLESPAQHTGIHMTADAKPLMHVFTTHDKQLTVGNDERNTVANNRSRRVGGNESVHVDKCAAQSVKEDVDVCVGGDQRFAITGYYAMRLGALYCNIKATSHLSCEAPFLMKSDKELWLQGMQGAQLFTPKELGLVGLEKASLLANGEILIQCGESYISMTPTQIVIKSARVDINP